MNILITGATGYLGAEVIRSLLPYRKHKLYALVRSEEKFQRLLHWCNADNQQLLPLKADICELSDLPAGIDTIIHAAACRLDNDPIEAEKVNIAATTNLLNLAVKSGANRFIYLSSQSIYGWQGAPWSEKAPASPKGIYAGSKYAGEKAVCRFDDRLNYLILRPARMCGVSLFTRWNELIPRFVNLIYQGKPISIYGDGNQRYDLIHVSDVAGFTAKIPEMYPDGWNDVYNIGSGGSMSLNEIVENLTHIASEMQLPPVQVIYKPQTGSGSPSHLELDTTHVRDKTCWIPHYRISDILRGYMTAYSKLSETQAKQL
jgi:nucleoside-diphosphate-sugar epimerase